MRKVIAFRSLFVTTICDCCKPQAQFGDYFLQMSNDLSYLFIIEGGCRLLGDLLSTHRDGQSSNSCDLYIVVLQKRDHVSDCICIANFAQSA